MDDGGDARILETAAKIERGNVRGPGPAVDRDLAVARVDPDRDLPGIEPRRLAHEIGVTDRRGAEDDARDPAFQPAAHRLHVAHAAAELHLYREPGEDAPDRLGVDRLAGEGAVEIDDMQVFEALIGEGSRLRGGVGVEHRRLRHVAAQEPDALAVLEVDGGKENHGRHRRKLAISARPSAWLFSGWNWVPAILSRATIAVTGPP